MSIISFATRAISRQLNKPNVKGALGEKYVERAIGNTIEGVQYILNNSIFESERATLQIDHIVINQHGVFVIETKNYSGMIYGQVDEEKWTQVWVNNPTNNVFYNPIMQNDAHAKYIVKILGDVPVKSLVVFVRGNISNIKSENVINLPKLKEKLETGENVLSVEQMKSIYHTLMGHISATTHKQHAENIKQKHPNTTNELCPKCGKKLVLRNGKYGSFWGCSNYPNCKFTKRQ